MKTFSFSIDTKLPLERVFSAFWQLDDWPQVAQHVVGIEMHYENPAVQVLEMLVNTNGQIDRFETVRIRKGNTIHYFQPAPPPMLKHHHGKWIFEEIPDGSRVTSVHTIEVEEHRARTLLHNYGADGDDCISVVQRIISNNSLQTMKALRDRLESESVLQESHVA